MEVTKGTVNTELPAAAALADATANPTAPAVGAHILLWNGTNWDRWQSESAVNPGIGKVILKTSNDDEAGTLGFPLYTQINVLTGGPNNETTASVTTSSATVLVAGSRSYLFLQNTSDTTIYVNLLGNAAVVDQCVKLYPGWSMDFPSQIPQSLITAIHAGSGSKNLYILYKQV